jgi:hypothetical protein
MADPKQTPSRFRLILNALRKLIGKNPPAPPGDPYAYAMAPLRRGPKGRSGAAVVEIEDEDSDRSYPPRRA